VLNEARAARLACRAGRARGDGTRGLLARRAWRILSEAGGRGDQAAIDAVLRYWLHDPDDERWQVLTRWRGAKAMTAAVLAAAAEPLRSPAERAAIGAFCARHELLPDDPVERALFFVLTGRGAEHQAADPDNSLIAAAYEKAHELTRRAVREAMSRDGDLDLPHTIADRRDPARYMSYEECQYLLRHLADEGDWERLWQLIRDLRLAEAVAAMRHFGGGWRPDCDADRALFDRLACADPAKVVRAGLNASEIIRIEMDDPPTHGAFSPDGRRLLVATERDGRYSGCRVFDLPTGTLAERHDYRGGLPPAAVLHLGRSYVVVGRRQAAGSPLSAVWELVCYAAGRVDVPYWSEQPMAVAARSRGFLVADTQESMRMTRGRTFQAEITGIRLQLRDLDGNVIRNAEIVSGHGLGSFPTRLESALAVDPTGRWLAIGTQELVVVDLTAERVVARLPAGRRPSLDRVIGGACFPRSNRLATIDRSGRVRLYQLDKDRLVERRARAKVSGAAPHDLVFIPYWGGEIAVIDGRKGVRYLDADTLKDVKRTGYFAGQRGTVLFGSPDGRHHALGGTRDTMGFVHVLWSGPDDVAALERRPVGAMTRADLAAVTARLRELGPGAFARPFLDLLRMCLERRFAADTGTDRADGPRDVAASPKDQRPC
jgi:hypothetical protein